MIRYRPQRGGLDEAMAEAREFNTIDEMKQYVWYRWNSFTDGRELFSAEDIVIGEILGDDNRIGWKNVRHVCVKRMGAQIYPTPQCIGWIGE